MLTSVDETLKGINASIFGMKKYEKAHAHSDPLSFEKGGISDVSLAMKKALCRICLRSQYKN